MVDIQAAIADIDNVKDSRKFNQWKFDTVDVLEHLMPPVSDVINKIKSLKFRSYVYAGGVNGNNLEEILPTAKSLLEGVLSQR